jgi:hypothetical protein
MGLWPGIKGDQACDHHSDTKQPVYCCKPPRDCSNRREVAVAGCAQRNKAEVEAIEPVYGRTPALC